MGAEADERTSGTSLATILLARPSKMAVFPTPGGPINYKIYLCILRPNVAGSTYHRIRLGAAG